MQRLTVNARAGRPRWRADPFIELWFGDLNHPDVGRSLLGRNRLARADALAEGGRARHVRHPHGGQESLGLRFRARGIYDRVQLARATSLHLPRPRLLNPMGLRTRRRPSPNRHLHHALAFFGAIRGSSSSSATASTGETGHRTFRGVRQNTGCLRLAGRAPEVKNPMRPGCASEVQGARDHAVRAADARRRRGLRLPRAAHAAVDAQEQVAGQRLQVHGVGLSASVSSAFGLMAQPSITQVLTWFHALLFQWNGRCSCPIRRSSCSGSSSSSPSSCLGRGLFCGWLCPFGSLSEALYKIGGAIGLKRFQFAAAKLARPPEVGQVRGVLRPAGGVDVLDGTAEMLAEVEPFKTTFLVGITNRAGPTWPVRRRAAGHLDVHRAAVLQSTSARSARRWRCPAPSAGSASRKQDATAAPPAQGLRLAGHRRRRSHRPPRMPCNCLDCMVLYTDDHACPPLAQERKRRERDGLLITPIGGTAISSHRRRWPAAGDQRGIREGGIRSTPGQRAGELPHLSGGWSQPPGAGDLGPPVAWSGEGWHNRQRPAGGRHLAGDRGHAAWAWAAMGGCPAAHRRLVVRLERLRGADPHARPPLRRGRPVVGRRYREAGWMDMLSYVGFKNLLIGAALFLALRASACFRVGR